MKTISIIIIVLFSLLSCNACSQKKGGGTVLLPEHPKALLFKDTPITTTGTITINGDGDNGATKGAKIFNADDFSVGDGYISIDYDSKYDTIKCIMLVCDTAHSNHGYDIDPVYWQYGYEVRNVTNHPVGFWRIADGIGYNEKEYNSYVHEIYLDENKKPISRSVIVWQSIKVN